MRRVLDEYEFDGIFNDMGYDGFDNKGNPYAYLCLSNLGKTGVNAVFKELWKDRVSGERVKEKEIPAGGMLFLQRL